MKMVSTERRQAIKCLGFCSGWRVMRSRQSRGKEGVHFINQQWGSSENFDAMMFLLLQQNFALQNHKRA